MDQQGTRQQDEAARILAGAPYLRDLIELDFDRTGLSAAAERALRERFGDGLVLTGPPPGLDQQP